jgi:chromosome segregation ATPase
MCIFRYIPEVGEDESLLPQPINHKRFAMNEPPPPDDPVWEHIRARYEAGEERVKEIAADIGVTFNQLTAKAKALGWKLRKAAKSVRKKVKQAAGTLDAALKPETTRQTLARLRELLQQRVALLEAEIKEIGEGVNALATDRQIKAVNLVVRTLEKVLDLERKDKLKRRQQTREYKYFDADQRSQLADKIDRLEGSRDNALAAAGPPRGGGAEQPVALLGETRPASTGSK